MTGMRRFNNGFTMIEILVVLIVVGLLAALAVANLGGNQQKREMENAVSKMFLLMQTASEQAVLDNSEIGLKLGEQEYRFLRFEGITGEWVPMKDRMFRNYQYPEWLVVTDIIEDNLPRLTTDEAPLRPDIVFFSSGEITPFEMEFTIGSDTDLMYRIYTDKTGQLDWLKPGEKEEQW
jgi:general secretion pathway protein H